MIFLRCPWCWEPKIVACHRLIGTATMFEPQPFAPLLETPPEDISSSALARWQQELPWRLGLGYLLPDHDHTTYDSVQKRAKSRPYPHPWWRPHTCPGMN